MNIGISGCMMFLMSLVLLSGWITVVSSITLMGVVFMDVVGNRMIGRLDILAKLGFP